MKQNSAFIKDLQYFTHAIFKCMFIQVIILLEVNEKLMKII